MGVVSLVGLLAGALIVAISCVVLGDYHWFLYKDGIIITVGGTICAGLVAFPHTRIFGAISSFFKIVFGGNPNAEPAFEALMEVARKARREGFVSLSVKGKGVNMEFLTTGVELLADGVDPEQIQSILMAKSELLSMEYKNGEKVFHTLGTIAPMWGLLGTVMGLVFMLNSLEDTARIPKAMAVALITTFYGIILSGLIFIPMANKFRMFNDLDLSVREMIISGILSIQSGDSSRLVQEKLEAYKIIK